MYGWLGQCLKGIPYVQLVTNIINNNIRHKNPYFGQREGGTWKQFYLDSGS